MPNNIVTEAVQAFVIYVQSWFVAANFAELEAPDGTETDEVFFVVCELPDGREFRHRKTFRDMAAAEALEARVKDAAAWGGPERNPHWYYFRSAYGSAHYARNVELFEAHTEFADRAAMTGDEAAAYHSLPDCMKAVLGSLPRADYCPEGEAVES